MESRQTKWEEGVYENIFFIIIIQKLDVGD